METPMLSFITRRRSIRSFTGEPVDREKLETALKAAMAAPSAQNTRPWHFLVSTEPENVKRICRAHPYAAFGVDAGAVIVPFGKKTGYRWFDQDMAAATENLLLALANLGLGATWCGMADEHQEPLRNAAGLPDEHHLFAVIPVGVPTEEKPARTQYDEERIHWETYRS